MWGGVVQTKMEGNRVALLPLRPLRTVHASFPAHGSSTLQASSGFEETRSFCCECPMRYASAAPSPYSGGRTHGFFRNPHLLFLLQKFSRFSRTKAPVGSLHPFRSGNFLPIQPVTGWHSLAPTSHTHSSIGIPYGLLPTVFCGDDWAYHVPLR
jgi:hypothetical protein